MLRLSNEAVHISLHEIGEKGKEKVCLIVVISQARDAVAVSVGGGHYSYPVRRETGITRGPRDEVPVQQLYLKSDNRDFMHELLQFIRDN